ncbi:MAG: hypothetical protein MJ102_01200 [Clostridia bacterium]|nr:hypothetical protein [Clostridia bacterium]
MDLIRKIWPTTFNVKKGDIVSLIIQIVILLVICAVASWLIGVLASIPVLGIIFGLLAGLIDIYSLVGIILCILNFFGKL